MPVNHLTDDCLHSMRGTLVFWEPQGSGPRLHGRVQIVDVFSLEVATGYSRDPQGRLLLHSAPSVAEGRSWSLAKAEQLIRNDARPHRWVALQMDNRAWGLFWAGGGLQRCREELADGVIDAEVCSALVPVSAERVLEVVLSQERSESLRHQQYGRQPQRTIVHWPSHQPRHSRVAWHWVALSSAVWLVILASITSGFVLLLERQNRTLDLLLERLEATDIKP